MNIETINIKIRGIKNKYEYLHISDAHLCLVGEDSPEVTLAYAAERNKLWTHEGVTPLEAFEDAFDTICRTPADGLFITGDLLEFISAANLRYIGEKLAEAGKDVIYVCGNHEISGDNPGMTGEGLAKPYIDNYTELMGGNVSFMSKEFDDLILVGLDDSTKCISEEQLDKLRGLSKKGKPIVLVMHIPILPHDTAREGFEFWNKESFAKYFALGIESDPDTTRRFREFVISEDSNVAAVIAGHIHFSFNGEFAPGRMQYAAAPLFTGHMRRYVILPE